jgi:hypothetical protein
MVLKREEVIEMRREIQCIILGAGGVVVGVALEIIALFSILMSVGLALVLGVLGSILCFIGGLTLLIGIVLGIYNYIQGK